MSNVLLEVVHRSVVDSLLFSKCMKTKLEKKIAVVVTPNKEKSTGNIMTNLLTHNFAYLFQKGHKSNDSGTRVVWLALFIRV